MNYTPSDIHDLIEKHIESAGKMEVSNLGGEGGSIFLDLCGFFKKQYYLEARKIDPTRFEKTLAVSGDTVISDVQKITGVFESDSDSAITDTQLIRTGRGSQTGGWWWDASSNTIKITGGLTDTFWVVYLPTFDKPAADSDDLLCPENNDEFVVAYFDRLIELWNFKGAGVNRIALTDQVLKNTMARHFEDIQPIVISSLPTNSAFL